MSAHSTATNSRLAECFGRAQQLSKANDYDYAHTLFAECVLHDPPNLAYVEALLQNLRRKLPRAPKKLFGFGGGACRELKQSVNQQQWAQALRIGLDRLTANPWDVMTLRMLAEVSAKLHHNEVELVYLKQALDAAPKDLEVNRHCARSLARMGQFDQAIACWHRIEILRPGDKEAAKMVGLLAEEKLKFADGQPPGAILAPTRISNTSENSSGDTSVSPSDIPSSPRLQLERAIADDPYDVSNYLELADLFLKLNNLEEAEAILNRGIATCGNHCALDSRLQRVRELLAQQEAELERMRRKEIASRNEPFRIPWLESTVLFAGLVLVLQIFPIAGAATLRVIDIRQWSQGNWLIAVVVVLAILLGIRLGPEILTPLSSRPKIRRRLRR